MQAVHFRTVQNTEPSFRLPIRVYYEDTDAGGVVYHANYLRFFERCRTEWLRALGFHQNELAQRDGIAFVVADAQIEYLRPARLDDELIIDARVSALHRSAISFEQYARRGAEYLCRARVRVVCVDAATLRPTRLPQTVTNLLQTGLPAASDTEPA